MRSRRADTLLEVENLSVNYGGVEAVKRVSLSVIQGELVTVIGANGAGKSSLLAALMGIVPKRSGHIKYQGQDITKAQPEALLPKGITLVPERRELFASMSVLDNLRLGAYYRYQQRDKGIPVDLERVFTTFPRLAERRKQLAGTMSGGEQQMLAIGRALMSNPQLLLLDEPSLGLAPLVVEEIFKVIAGLREEGRTVLLVEQNARAALALADYGYVMETGEVVLGGDAASLVHHERVAAAYLGLG